MSRPRDRQRARVYKAETLCSFFLRDKAPIRDLDEIANEIIQSAWWSRLHPEVTYANVRKARSGARRGTCYVRRKLITLPPGTQYVGYLLHEIAHLPEGVGEEPHGPRFTRTYIELVRFYYGQDDAYQLASSFEWEKVRVAPLVGTTRKVEPLSSRRSRYEPT